MGRAREREYTLGLAKGLDFEDEGVIDEMSR